VSWNGLFDYLRREGLNQWAGKLEAEQPSWLVQHGDYARWLAALEALPEISNARACFNNAEVAVAGNCDAGEGLRAALKGLMPWRKGPYRFADVIVDSEWRSDLKWERVLPHLATLEQRRVLDIGCGNGYHCWRMLAQAPRLVVGIDPSVLFNLQFQALQKYLHRDDIYLLPIGVESMPEDLNWFDTVFSMGVLYHRRSPLDHLLQLRSFLVAGGELCLETLVIEAGAGRVLLPRGRYARMRNVWFIPSAQELLRWVQRCGFENVRVVDETTTTPDEQRATEWMQFESLQQCLNEKNAALTVEDYPAPRRAVILANRV